MTCARHCFSFPSDLIFLTANLTACDSDVNGFQMVNNRNRKNKQKEKKCRLKTSKTLHFKKVELFYRCAQHTHIMFNTMFLPVALPTWSFRTMWQKIYFLADFYWPSIIINHWVCLYKLKSILFVGQYLRFSFAASRLVNCNHQLKYSDYYDK